jgi:hypothetical protein
MIHSGKPSELVVHWRRPVDFMNSNEEIQVFNKSVEPADIKAGPNSY